MKSLAIAAAAALMLMAADASAAEWSGEASLTGSKTTGNTDTEDIGVGLKLDKTQNLFKHRFRASADFGRANGVRNRARAKANYRLDRDIGDDLFVFGSGDVFYDEFGAFTDGWFVGGGLGYTIYEPDPVGWNVTAGVGYRSQTSSIDVTEQEIALNAESDFDWQLNEAVSVYDDAGVLYSAANTYLYNEIGLTASLMGNLAARASFRIDYNSDVPVGRENTDTITRFGIVYTIN
jgi:putative salt-induced outer membrane protein